MKKIFTPFLMLVLVFTSCNQPVAEEAPSTTLGLYTPYFMLNDVLKGNVKELTEHSYYVNEMDGTIEKAGSLAELEGDSINWMEDFKVMFDEAGKVLSTHFLGVDNKINYSYINTIEEGVVVKSDMIVNDTIKGSSTITYENGQMKEMTRYSQPADTIFDVITAKRDSTGLALGWVFKKPDGTMKFKYKLVYDDQGRQTGYEFYRNDELASEVKVTYNDNGDIEQWYSKRGDEEVTEDNSYEFDEQGNWVYRLAVSSLGYKVITEREITYFE